jgi:aminoglycoside phosphotransferase (APT) family kinase protein
VTGLDEVVRTASVVADLDWWAEYLDWAFGDAPITTLTDVLSELRATAPPDVAPAIRWGDPRLGNVVYAEDRTVRAALDWELATIGAPEADLAWYLALDDVVASFVDRRLPAFLDRAGVIAAYEQELGRPVEHLPWHELFALLRSAAISARIARIAAAADRKPATAAGGDDDPVVGYLRRRLETVRSAS